MFFLSSHSLEIQAQVAPWCRDCPGLARDNMPPTPAGRTSVLEWCPLHPCQALFVQVTWCVFGMCVCESLTVGNQNGVFFTGSKPLGVASLEPWMYQSAFLGTGNIDPKWDLMSSSTGREK